MFGRARRIDGNGTRGRRTGPALLCSLAFYGALVACATVRAAANPPSFVGSSVAPVSSTAVNSLSMTAPSGLAVGDVMIAGVTQNLSTSSATSVNLSSYFNVSEFSNNGTAPANGGFDGSSYAFSATLATATVNWNGANFTVAKSSTYSGVANKTITLPSGSYASLMFLASTGFGPHTNQVFTVTYTDGSTSTFTQSMSDWGYFSAEPGESQAFCMAYRIEPNGGTGTDGTTTGWCLYGYSFALNSAKTVKTLTLPNSSQIVVTAVDLVPPASTGSVPANPVSAAPTGWTYQTAAANGQIDMGVYYRVATSADVAGSTIYTFTLTTTDFSAGSILAYRGVSSTAPITSSASQSNAAATSYTAPAITYTPNTTWVGLYAIANGTTASSGSDFGAPDGGAATQVVDVGTQSGTSGILYGEFYYLATGGCGSSCPSGAWTATSTTSTSAISIGISLSLVAPIVAQWHMDEIAWSGTAGEVVDAGGNGYNGVAVGGATTAGTSPALGGTSGTCYYGSFNASSTYVQLPASLGHLGQTFTITAWIKPTSIAAGRIFWDDYNLDGLDLGFDDANDSKMHFYMRKPSSQNFQSGVTLSTNQWYFVAISVDAVTNKTMTLLTYSSSGSLLDSQSASITAFTPSTGPYSTIGGNATGSSEGALYRFPGNIDEVTLYDTALTTAQITAKALATHTCTASVPNHYAVSTPGTAVNCQPAAVTISAHTSSHGAIATPDTITLSTTTGHGDWTLTTGAGILTAGGSNSGGASYAFSSADGGVATLALRDTYAETLTIGVTDGTVTATSGTATASEDLPLTFVASGFRITNGSNSPVTIATQVAGVTSTQSLALQAVRTDNNTGACTSVFASGTTVNIGLAYQCNNPASCIAGQSLTLTNNGTGTSLASNPASGITTYTTVPLKFSTANAEAPFTLNYSDVGQITLAAKYTIPLGSGAGSGNTMTGASQFVVQPYTLKLSNITSTASGAANPAASTASGTVFIGAGQSFTQTVTASNAQGAATPNFGKETSPATVVLSPTLVLPASGHNPSVSGAFGAYTSGSATGTSFSWPEVGIITQTPTVNYLSTGTVTGTTSGNVGRFIPNNFATTLNSPVFGTACGAGGFTYVGQPFTYYSSAPIITATAQALGATTTQNYTGSFMRLTNGSLTGRAYTPTPASPALTLTGLPPTSSDPTISDQGGGVVTLTFSASSVLSFTRGTPIQPFNASIALSENVIDLDGVAASNPVTFNGTGNGIFFSTGTAQVYGRLALRNTLGSELLDLPMHLIVQSYSNSTVGWTTATSDSCTAAPALTFSGYLQNLSSGKTCVRDSGSPGVSGLGCSAAASPRYNAVAAAGDFDLILAAPGSGNNGAVTVTAAAPSYLQYLWSVSSGSNSNPSGMATFGIFPGPASRIYQREVY